MHAPVQKIPIFCKSSVAGKYTKPFFSFSNDTGIRKVTFKIFIS